MHSNFTYHIAEEYSVRCSASCRLSFEWWQPEARGMNWCWPFAQPENGHLELQELMTQLQHLRLGLWGYQSPGYLYGGTSSSSAILLQHHGKITSVNPNWVWDPAMKNPGLNPRGNLAWLWVWGVQGVKHGPVGSLELPVVKAAAVKV